MRLGHARERQRRADHGLDQAALDEARERVELAPVLAGEHEVVGGVLAPGLDEVLRLRDVDEADHAPECRERQRASA